MAKKTVQRKLEVYHLHGHIGKNAIPNYGVIFQQFSQVPPDDRVLTKHGNLVCVSTCKEVRPGIFHLVAHEGEPGVKPLLLDLNSFSERSSSVRQHELLSTRTHCVINANTRRAAIEFNQKGVKSDDLGNLVRTVLESQYNDALTFEFTPVIKQSFLSDVQGLSRVRLASVSMVRPNMAWNQDAATLVDGARLEDSEAQRLQLLITARPNQSLSKTRGFIRGLDQLIRQGVTSITQATVKGRQPDKNEEVTISLNNHVESTRVTIARDGAGHPASNDVLKQLEKLV